MESKYEINRGTLALIPLEEKLTQVIELDDSFLISCSANKIIDNSCRSFGSSYSGRSEGTKSLLGLNYKAPIIISEAKEIIFFPTTSPRSNKCCWISLNNIVNYQKDNSNTIINFQNNRQLKLDISSFIIENQIYKATMLESKLRKLTLN